MDSREAYLILNMLDHVGPVKVRAMLQFFDTVEDIFSAGKERLMRVHGIGEETANSIVQWQQNIDLDKELKRIEEACVSVLIQSDEAYPKHLRQIHDPPLVLYLRGKLQDRDNHGIAVVGSRNTTLYGREAARKLSFQLAHCGVTVVSGLAAGIDTSAHQGALQAKGRTIAVVASGLDTVYPAENRTLHDQIVESGGAIVSEFPFGTKPISTNFPMRNRIVSGMTLGTLVIEAGLNSGALITATQALDQGRPLFAVPGRIDSQQSKGSHKLIKNGAKLVEGVEDILEEFEYLFPKSSHAGSAEPPSPIQLNLGENEQKVLALISEDEISMDEIVRASGLPTAQVSSTLLTLEMKRLVRQLPGKRFVRRTAEER